MLVLRGTGQMALGDMGGVELSLPNLWVPRVAVGWGSPDTANMCLLEELGLMGNSSTPSQMLLCVCVPPQCFMAHAGLIEASGVC